MSFSNPINIPSGSNATMEMTSFTSPISISSPFSSSSGGAAISFATTITSPPTSDDGSNAAQQQLKKHKPHKCDICNACFARKVHLQRHALRHQNGKPYCCDRCGKCFSRQDSLVRHHRLLHENMVKEVSKPNNKQAITTGKKTKKTNKRACIRCDSITVKCDGKQPCSRCVSNHGGESCCYSHSNSFPTTIGQASKQQQSTRSRQRHDSIATTSSSMITIDDDDNSIASSTTWGQQFPVLSVFQQSQMQQQFIPHPFELPQMDGLLMESSKPSLVSDLPNFFSICPPQQQFFQQQQHPLPLPQPQMLPMFDWSSLMQEQQEESLPFSGSASNKDLNGTLLSEEAIIQDSTFPSPSIHALQQHNLHMHDLANARIQTQNGGDLSAFAMAIAQNNHQSFDGLIRSLSGYGMRNNNGESLVV